MSFPENNSDIIEVSPQIPKKKRPRISENNQSNALTCPPASNKETDNIFFKTRICNKFKSGNCRKGENCTYAHGVAEIRQPPPNWKEIAGARNEVRLQLGSWDEDQKIIHKMELCRKYYNGEECPYGDKCRYIHRLRDDSLKSRDGSAVRIGSIGDDSSNMEGNRAVDKPARGTNMKTNLCLTWQQTGSCPFGEDCDFAHGKAELQVPGGGNDAPTSIPASLGVAKEEGQAKKKPLLWWKSNKKINTIYGDWIDDSRLVLPNLPSADET